MNWIPEIGLFALLLVLPLALVAGAAGFWKEREQGVGLQAQVLHLMWLLVAVAFAMLMSSHLLSDFTVEVVASHSHLAKPWLYKLTGVWGNHEGSMLLWLLILAGFSSLFARWAMPRMEAVERSVSYAVLALLQGGVTAFIVFTSSPFSRQFPPPPDGSGLNPVLQDIGLAIHPPMLYLGYVGAAVPFAMAVAFLWRGQFTAREAALVRPWALLCWGVLSFGIGLGSWWAYRELGWGGWWFWDPVENASLLPWLSGIAALHGLTATVKRGLFPRMTLLLLLLSFGLSLLGTFLVRSGVLNSVHAFANDPARGVFILCFLALVMGGAFALYARANLRTPPPGTYGVVSRDLALGVQHVLLLTALSIVLLGTLYPLAMELLAKTAVALSPAYYNHLFAPLAAAGLVLAASAAGLRWGKDRLRRFVAANKWSLLFAALCTGSGIVAVMHVLPAPGQVWVWGLVFAALWLLSVSLHHAWRERKAASRAPYWSSVLGHVGFSLLVLGAVITGFWSTQTDTALSVGQDHAWSGWSAHYEGYERAEGPDYEALRTEIHLWSGKRQVAILHPERRFYPVQGLTTAEAARASFWWGDLYAVVGESDAKGRVGLRLMAVPGIGLVWLSILILGGVALSKAARLFFNQ